MKKIEKKYLTNSCGHIISEFNGGELKLDNLMPICNSCNSSMGTKNMNEYICEFGF
jgi:5-methylcytosine-specific restriction endonuclease McrA